MWTYSREVHKVRQQKSRPGYLLSAGCQTGSWRVQKLNMAEYVWRKSFRTFHKWPFICSIFGVKAQCSCCDVSHSGQRRGQARQHRSKLPFLGQSLFLFRPVCGQSHSEASGPKVSRSIILILHCKQTGCVLLRCRSDTEISSLSAADKRYVFGNGRRSDCWIPSSTDSNHRADSKDEYGPRHAMYYAKSCSFLENRRVRFFRAEPKWAERDAELWCWWRCVALSYSNRCFTKNTQGAWWDVFKGHCYSVIKGSSPELHHTVPVSKYQTCNYFSLNKSKVLFVHLNSLKRRWTFKYVMTWGIQGQLL